MKKFLTLIIFSLALSSTASATDQLFGVSLRVIRPIIINSVQPLTFSATSAGADLNGLAFKAGRGAAIFNIQAKSGKNRSITSSIVESSISMSAPEVNKTISAGNFTVSGPKAFDAYGDAKNIRVAATANANVLAAGKSGNYVGTATLRVLYL